MTEKASEILAKYWGYNTFRAPQIPIVESILAHNNTLAILTTGGGKSICFQVPAMCMDGMCLVISPLIALMKDQVFHLRSKKIPSAALYSGQTKEEQDTIVQGCIDGKVKFLYVSPERLQSTVFIHSIRQFHIRMLVIDEAHCISQWGYDFRPHYLQIPSIYTYLQNPIVVALTATATHRVIEDIQDKLHLPQMNVLTSSFFKPNLSYQIQPSETKIATLIQLIQSKKTTGIIYVNKRKLTIELSKILNENSIESDYYHAGLSLDLRNKKQETWLQKPNAVMVCTNAFGMGIDNPKVDYVIHFNPPSSIESYFQECGRAGRNGQYSEAISLISRADMVELEAEISTYPTIMEVKAVLTMLFNLYQIPLENGMNQMFEFDFEKLIQTYQLNTRHTLKCIEILKDNECIYLQDEFFKPDEIQLLFNDYELREFYQNYPDYESFIKNLLRSYEGLHYAKKVNLYSLARSYHYHIDEIKEKLHQLQRWEVIRYQEATSKPTITFLIHKHNTADYNIDSEQYQERKKNKLNQIKRILDYIQNRVECRSIQLLRYFDEPNMKPCGICDVCRVSAKQKTVSAEDYIFIRDNILQKMDKKIYTPIETLLKWNQKYPPQAVRKVIDRMIELNQLIKGEGHTFKLI